MFQNIKYENKNVKSLFLYYALFIEGKNKLTRQSQEQRVRTSNLNCMSRPFYFHYAIHDLNKRFKELQDSISSENNLVSKEIIETW